MAGTIDKVILEKIIDTVIGNFKENEAKINDILNKIEWPSPEIPPEIDQVEAKY